MKTMEALLVCFQGHLNVTSKPVEVSDQPYAWF